MYSMSGFQQYRAGEKMADATKIDDEIDLGELFASLWAYKTLIGIVTALAIVAGGFYALNAEKIYTAKAVFKLPDSGNSGFNLPSEVSGLAALAGLGGIAGSGDTLFDRVQGRAFILDIDKAADLRDDRYFNDFNPDAKDPLWKATIKRLIGYSSDVQDPDQLIDENIVTAFRENVVIEATENGATSVKVNHPDSVRAAAIANAVMDRIITQTEQEKRQQQDKRLAYLSENLAKNLREMENTQEHLKNFAVENSAFSTEALATGSVALDDARNRLARTTDLLNAVNALLEAVDQGKANTQSYTTLRKAYPIIDDVEFRRVLGLSEIISGFTWPDRDLLAGVAATLEDRRTRIEQERNRLEKEATAYADAAEQQARLQGEADIAEASYTVLLQLVKSESLQAGYEGNTAKIFERATAPISPSKPNRKLYIVLAAMLGMFFGSAIALILSLRKGVFFSRRAMLDELQPITVVTATRLKKLNGRSMTDIRTRLAAVRDRTLTEVSVAIGRQATGPAIVIGGNARCTARTAALATAITVAGSGKSVALVDLSRTGSASAEGETAPGHWAEIQSDDGVVELAFTTARENIDLLASPKFSEAVAELTNTYDQVIFSVEPALAEMAAAGLASLAPTAILVARPKRTPKSLIHKLRQLSFPTILMLE
jgi:polysaccharide biosynthesis transport protein